MESQKVTEVTELNAEISRLAHLMSDHHRTPGAWKRNILAFLYNMAEKVKDRKAWNWAITAVRRQWSKIDSPFGYVRACLLNPLEDMVKDKEQRMRTITEIFKSWEPETNILPSPSFEEERDFYGGTKKTAPSFY